MSNNTHHDVSGRSRLVSNVITSWLSHLLIIITGFFMPRLIDEKLGQEMLGIWDFSWSLVAYLTLAQLGIGSALNRFVAGYRADNELGKLKTATSTVTFIQVCLATLIAVAVLSVTYILPNLYQDKLGDDLHTAQMVVLNLGLAIAAQFLFDTSRGILTGSHRWDLYNALYSGNQVVSSLLMITALIMGEGLITISFIYLVMIIFEGLLRSMLALKICPESSFRAKSISKKFAIEITSFGLKSFVMGITGIVIIQSCSIVVATTLGPAALAILARPNALIKHIQTFITRFTFVLIPMAGTIRSKEGPEALKEFTLSCSLYGLAFTLPLLTLFCFYGDELIHHWMGSNYVNERLVLILGLSAILPISQSSLSSVLIGLNQHGKAALISVSLALPMLIIGLQVISKTGPSIEAYALLIGIILSSVNGVAIPYYALTRLNISISLYIRSVFVKILPIWLFTALQLFLFDKMTTYGNIWILLNIGLYLVTTALLYWNFILSNDAKKKLRDRIFPINKE